MNYIDIAFIVVLAWGMIRGFRKGLIVQIASIGALVLGVYCSVYFSHEAIPYLQKIIGSKSPLIPLLSFGATFAAVIIAVHLIGKSVEKLVDIIALGLVNKLLGAFFGFLKFVLIISVLLSLMYQIDNRVKYIPTSLTNGSLLHDPLESIAPLLVPGIKSFVEKHQKED